MSVRVSSVHSPLGDGGEHTEAADVTSDSQELHVLLQESWGSAPW